VLARIGGAELVGPADDLAPAPIDRPATAMMIRLASLALFVATWWSARISRASGCCRIRSGA
jgi:hypothetical protein